MIVGGLRFTLFAIFMALLGARSAAGGIDDATHPLHPDGPFIVLHTVGGDIVLALYPESAPNTVSQVLKLAEAGVYDTMHFARVDPPSIIQLGSPRERRVALSSKQRAVLEFVDADVENGLKHETGTLSMPGRTDSNGNVGSFSILLASAPHLDGHSVVFGHVVRGLDVVEALTRVNRDEKNRPLARLSVENAEVVDSAEDLAGLRLRGVIPIRDPYEVEPSTRAVYNVITGGLIVVAALALASFFFFGQLSPRHHRSFSLLQVLICALLIFMLQTPLAHDAPMLGGVLFIGLVGLFKLMSRFET